MTFKIIPPAQMVTIWYRTDEWDATEHEWTGGPYDATPFPELGAGFEFYRDHPMASVTAMKVWTRL